MAVLHLVAAVHGPLLAAEPMCTAIVVHQLRPRPTEYCTVQPALCIMLQGLKADLATYWPSWTQPDLCFYRHEWDKHGTCAMAELNGGAAGYFSEVQ